MAPNVGSAHFAQLLKTRAEQHAARFGKAGAAKELRIVFNRHSYKNAALALVVYDANEASGHMAVVDIASGRVQGETDVVTIDSMAGTGVVGAIIAAAQDKQQVDERLADGLAKSALRRAYGSALVDPVLYPDAIGVKPAPSPVPETPADNAKPAPKPAPVPVAAKHHQRTAMAVVPTPMIR